MECQLHFPSSQITSLASILICSHVLGLPSGIFQNITHQNYVYIPPNFPMRSTCTAHRILDFTIVTILGDLYRSRRFSEM